MGLKIRDEMTALHNWSVTLIFLTSIKVNHKIFFPPLCIGFSIQNVCKRYFGININYVGYLDYDASVWQSVKKRKPLLMEFPNSKLVNNFDRMVQKLLDNA